MRSLPDEIHDKACFLLGTTAVLGVSATAVENANTVVVSILAYASMDNEDDLDTEAEYPVRYTD